MDVLLLNKIFFGLKSKCNIRCRSCGGSRSVKNPLPNPLLFSYLAPPSPHYEFHFFFICLWWWQEAVADTVGSVTVSVDDEMAEEALERISVSHPLMTC